MPRNFNDPFTAYLTDLDSPAQYAVEITPTDDSVLTKSIRGCTSVQRETYIAVLWELLIQTIQKQMFFFSLFPQEQFFP